MATLRKVEVAAVRKLAHRYSAMLQRRIYDQVVCQLLEHATRTGQTIDSPAARSLAKGIAAQAVKATPEDALDHSGTTVKFPASALTITVD